MASNHTPQSFQIEPSYHQSSNDEILQLCQEILSIDRLNNPKKRVQAIEDESKEEYRKVKKLRQNEIYSRRPTPSTSDKKKEKKKIDNNASSVASRAKRDFYRRVLTDLTEETMKVNVQLAQAVLKREQENTTLIMELNRLKSHLFYLQSQSSFSSVCQNDNMMVIDIPTDNHLNQRFGNTFIQQSNNYPSFNHQNDSNRQETDAINHILELNSLSNQEELLAKEKFDNTYDMYELARQEVLKSELCREDHLPAHPVA